MIRQIFIKDWRLLWPMVAMTSAIQAGRVWAGFNADLFQQRPAAEALLNPLTAAWFIAIAALSAAVVHQDAPAVAEQDWLIRPLSRTELLLAKLAFLAASITLPMVLLDLAGAWAMRMPPAASLEAVLTKDLFVFACFIVPVAALASATRNLTELIVLGAGLLLVFSLSVGASALFRGAGWCPTCGSGMAWLQHVVQHAGILLGAGVIFFLQYYRRRPDVAWVVALLGAAALALLQVSWRDAVAIEQWLSPGGAGPGRLTTIELDAAPTVTATSPTGKRAPIESATPRSLGDRADRVLDALLRRANPSAGAPVALTLSLRGSGLSADQLLLVDRSQVRIIGDRGSLLYRSANAEPPTGWLAANRDESAPAGIASQSIEIPRDAYRGGAAVTAHATATAHAAVTAQLRVDYTLTRVAVRVAQTIRALDGELRSPEVGYCATRLRHDTVSLHCKTVGAAPFCYSAALYAADGRHGPEVFNCQPDYRPRHWPTLIDVLSPYGVELPAATSEELRTSHVVLRIYRELDHFERTLVVAPLPPDAVPLPPDVLPQ